MMCKWMPSKPLLRVWPTRATMASRLIAAAKQAAVTPPLPLAMAPFNGVVARLVPTYERGYRSIRRKLRAPQTLTSSSEVSHVRTAHMNAPRTGSPLNATMWNATTSKSWSALLKSGRYAHADH